MALGRLENEGDLERFVNDRIEDVLRRVRLLETAGPWHTVGDTNEPAFQNWWVNYDATNYQAAQFRRDATGRVWLRGLVKSGVVGAIFTLPEGYRPPKPVHLPGIGNGVFGQLRVETNGDVRIDSGASNVWLSLDNINFAAS